jgi:enoyl-CoA hydratase/carnithine racemase
VGDYSTITFEIGDDHVATITLNRPEVMNSFNETMSAEIVDVWGIVRDTDEVHAVVLRAEGERAFCTGIDVTEGVWWYHLNIWNQMDPGSWLGPKAHKCWKPVVAAVHGMCAGGGQYFINEADIIICSDDATFFDPHASRGVVSALEPIGLLKRNVPLGDVLRWALLGNEERLTAETALRLGIVTEVVARDALWTRAHELAAEIATRRPEAIQGSVRAIWEAVDMTRATALQNGILYTHIGNPSPDEKPRIAPKQQPRFR